MKKIKYLFGICAVLALFGCENSEDKQLKENILMYKTYVSDVLVDTEGDGFVMSLDFSSKYWSLSGYYAKFVDGVENAPDHFFIGGSPWEVKKQKIFFYKDGKEKYSGDISEDGKVLLLKFPNNNIITFTFCERTLL